jgi:hypothetical protein
VDPADPDSEPDPQHCSLKIRSTKEDFLFLSAILCAVTENLIVCLVYKLIPGLIVHAEKEPGLHSLLRLEQPRRSTFEGNGVFLHQKEIQSITMKNMCVFKELKIV